MSHPSESRIIRIQRKTRRTAGIFNAMAQRPKHAGKTALPSLAPEGRHVNREAQKLEREQAKLYT